MHELIIGGAALNKEVEQFLKKINFPFTVGYGMTECGPLISYAPWEQSRATSCGKIVDRMQARIDSSDPENIVGELHVKGDSPECRRAGVRFQWSRCRAADRPNRPHG